MPASRLAAGCVLPFATATSICRRIFTICSGVCFLGFAIPCSFHTSLSHSHWYRISRALQVSCAQVHARRTQRKQGKFAFALDLARSRTHFACQLEGPSCCKCFHPVPRSETDFSLIDMNVHAQACCNVACVVGTDLDGCKHRRL